MLAILALAACEPKAEEPALDGAPELEGAPAPAPGDPAALDGAGPAAPVAIGTVLPGVIGIVAPMGMQPIESCETVIAADYTNPPKMTCLLFQAEDNEPGKLDAGFITAMSGAGWNFIRAQGDQHYFERPRAGTDCADLAAVSVVGDRLQAVIDHAGAGRPAGGAVWQAYAIPASTRETCGADRMKP
jgi:hypothetical protein